MTESEDLKPLLEAVARHADRMANAHGFLYSQIVNPEDAAISADALRARTPRIVPPSTLRGDFIDIPEAFIPLTSPHSREVLKALQAHGEHYDSLIGQGLSEERAKAEAARELDRVTSMGMAKARHDALARYTEHPILSALLTEHAPVEVKHGYRTYLECHACPDYYDDDHGADAKPEWPCPTWTTIAEQTEGAA